MKWLPGKLPCPDCGGLESRVLLTGGRRGGGKAIVQRTHECQRCGVRFISTQTYARKVGQAA